MPESQKPKCDSPEAENADEKPNPNAQDEKERRYYYDDAHGYQDFIDEEEDDGEEE